MIKRLEPKDLIIEERIRKETPIADLVKSIKTSGQLLPVLVTPVDDGGEELKYRLIAGYRRMKACEKLGIKVEAKVIDADPKSAIAIELIENIVRKDFTPAERAAGIKQFHDYLVSISDDQWTQDRTANYLGISRATVSDSIGIVDLLSRAEISEEDASKLTQTQLRTLSRKKNTISVVLDQIAKKAEVKKKDEEKKRDIQISNLDFLKEELHLGTFDIIFTDPPYGIDYDENETLMDKMTGTKYEDSFDDAKVDKMFKQFHSHLNETGILLTFCATSRFEFWKFKAKTAGFRLVCGLPIIWDKGGGRQPNVKLYPIPSYEVLLLAYKNKGQLYKTGWRNIISCSPVAAVNLSHIAEKPVPLIIELLDKVVAPGKSLLDPFCGSGAILEGAYTYGLSTIVGTDINPKCITIAKKRLSVATK